MEVDEEMTNQFLEYLDEAVIDLQKHINEIQSSSPKAIDEIYGIVHNLKGMGMTFKYDLLTEIGADFCSYIKGLPDEAQADTELVSDYVKVFTLIIQHRITGDGGEKGQAIFARMREKTAASLQG